MSKNESDHRVLILSPHPDDAELSMGGTICMLVEQGWEVVLADLTNGEPTPNGSPEIRAREAAKAAEIMGVTERVCLGLPNRFVMETLEARRVVAECIRKYRPRWLFSVALPDAHPDHIHTHALVQDARFTAKLSKTDMAHEPHYPKRLIYFFASHLRQHIDPSFVVDVSAYWPRKQAAIEAYESQFHFNQNSPADRGWIVDHVAAISHYFGTRVGVEHAEPFYCDDLLALSDLGSVVP